MDGMLISYEEIRVNPKDISPNVLVDYTIKHNEQLYRTYFVFDQPLLGNTPSEICKAILELSEFGLGWIVFLPDWSYDGFIETLKEVGSENEYEITINDSNHRESQEMWVQHFQDLITALGSKVEHDTNPLKLVFRDIVFVPYEGSTEMTTWYRAIKDVWKISGEETVEFAYGVLSRGAILEDGIVSIEHLVVMDSNTNKPIGVISKQILEELLRSHPLHKQPGILSSKSSGLDTVMNCFIRDEYIVKIPNTATKDQAHETVGRIKDQFMLTRALFVVNETNEIIGFATLGDVW